MQATTNRMIPGVVLLALLFALFFQGSNAFAQTITNWNNLTNWFATSVPPGANNNWLSIASSSDGNRLVAVNTDGTSSGGIWLSTNAGTTWTQTSAPVTNWAFVTSSANGSNLVATSGLEAAGGIWYSSDAGANWMQSDAPATNWYVVASSANGSNVVAENFGIGGIWLSTDAGATWTQSSAPSAEWQYLASSANGSNLVAVTMGDGIWISTNAGTGWTLNFSPPNYPTYSWDWAAAASSADGGAMFAANLPGQLWCSTNTGMTWFQETNAPLVRSVFCSADGTKLVAGTYGENFWISTNSAASWILCSASSFSWYQVASSSDFTRLVAGGGGIWTAQALEPTNGPPLVLNLFSDGSAQGVDAYWPNMAGWTLYQNTNLVDQCGWTPATNVLTYPFGNFGTNYDTIEPAPPSMFFQFRYSP